MLNTDKYRCLRYYRFDTPLSMKHLKNRQKWGNNEKRISLSKLKSTAEHPRVQDSVLSAMKIRWKCYYESICRHWICRSPFNLNQAVLLFLAKPMVSDIDMAESSLDDFIMDHRSDGLTIITVDDCTGSFKADILEKSMPPTYLLSCFW